MEFSMLIHEKGTQNEIIAACDSELIGMTISDEEKEIEFTVSPEFYGNEKLKWEDIREKIINGRNVNIIGNEIIDMAVKDGIINPSNTIEINGVKHAQIYAI